MTANSVTSVSLDPMLVLVCLTKGARTSLAIQAAERLAINILGEHQEDLCRRFARPVRITSRASRSRRPARAAAPPRLPRPPDGRVTEVVEAGDHDVVFAEVDHVHVNPNGGAPLLFFQGGYRRLPGMTRLG